jgi:chromosome segregation ATPase
VIEQTKLPGWRLVAPPESGVDQTADAYRVAVDLKPGENKTVTLALEAPRLQTMRVATLDDATVAELSASTELDPAAKQAFAELARLRRAAAEKHAVEQKLATEIATLRDDQARIRENLAQVDRDSALHKRYIDKLAQQETQFERLQDEATKAADAARAANDAVATYIAKLAL